MSLIGEYILGKQEEAEVQAWEIKMRYHALTRVWGINNPTVIVAVISDPLAKLVAIHRELSCLGGKQAAAGIALPDEISLMVMKEKSWECVRKWYIDHGLELDVERDDYISQLSFSDDRSEARTENN